MILGISSCLNHQSPEDWAEKHVVLGLKCVNFPVTFDQGREKYMAYKNAADKAGLKIAEVGVWRNTLAADPAERKKWIDFAVGQLKMADEIGALCAVNVAGTPHGLRWDGGYRENFSRKTWDEIVSMIQEIIDRAEPKNAKYSIESMPWMVPTGPDEYLKLMKDVNRPQFAAHLDVVNMITSPQRYFFNDDFLRECFDKLHGKILSCHLKDIRLKEEYTFQLQECACGEGSLDINLFAELATKENPEMPMIIEHLNTDEEYIASIRYVQKRLGIQEL
ncbi:sugar phosphate isomerase/epimerase [Treponema sp.]|uniref:sugar phosphate isomerase/epimerase family protein n=1 Tax=Treponema sp. TaxID=166 RepID=UPI00298DDE3D|nr:sugar phosphate isomerase/epimerase [Treponema sp.]MCQ2241674.1 sugar phosphate isomerase/epimerase [Treponema sp.]